MSALSPLFLKRLEEIIPSEYFNSCLKSFSTDKFLSVRINTLKIDKASILRILEDRKILFDDVPWCNTALILENISQKELSQTELIQNGFLYVQSLSSMLPSLVLDPQPGENILDVCAAPGSKTTQMAALMKNEGSIVALEQVKERFYKLKTVVSLLDARIVTLKLMDARRFRPNGNFFDRILVDAPCSSEGRFKIQDKKTYFYWSPRKIKEMVQKQRGLLRSASRLLKSDGTLVYSTCTFAPEENEAVVDWLLRKTDNTMEVLPIHFDSLLTYPALRRWKNKEFDGQVSNCLRVLPNDTAEGFFMAKLRKK